MNAPKVGSSGGILPTIDMLKKKLDRKTNYNKKNIKLGPIGFFLPLPIVGCILKYKLMLPHMMYGSRLHPTKEQVAKVKKKMIIILKVKS
jgi:hypothetical protein